MTDVFRGNSLFPGSFFLKNAKIEEKLQKKIEIMKKHLDLYGT